jgi:phosphatidate cytidylyltransferase
MKNLITRSKTALVFVAVVLVSIWWNQWTYLALMLAIISLSLWEYYGVTGKIITKNKVSFLYKYLAVFLGCTLFLASFFPILNYPTDHKQALSETLFFYFIIPLLPVFIFLIFEMLAGSEMPFQNVGINITGFYYIAVPVSMTNFIVFETGAYRSLPLIGVILLIWANDAFAYLVGSAIGRHKIFPRISPGKTWEGTVGGIAGNFIAAFLIFSVFNLYGLSDWLLIAGLVSVFATLGDWAESMLKRSLNIKDTGSLFPGHGGMLDRFDAFFFTIPFVALYFLLFKNQG